MPTCLPSCTPTECLAVAGCSSIIQIGSVPAPGTYLVNFENIATGGVKTFLVVVDLTLQVNVTLAGVPFLDAANMWRVWVILQGGSLYDYQPVTIGTGQYNCFMLNFTKTESAFGTQALTPLI